MRSLLSKIVRFVVIATMVLMATGFTPGVVASAPIPGLWSCSPFGTTDEYVCTTITSAPSSGVQVLDYGPYPPQPYTLYNGNSVALLRWYMDRSGLCGVHGNWFVWTVVWWNGGYHEAYIGDYFLSTGTMPNWTVVEDSWGPLGNTNHYFGTGSGTCNVFP